MFVLCDPGSAKPAERHQSHLPAGDDVGLRSVRLGTRQPGLHVPLHHLQLTSRYSNQLVTLHRDAGSLSTQQGKTDLLDSVYRSVT